MSETKKCAQCGQEKSIEDFSKSYKNLCKSCVAENVRNKRIENSHYKDGYVCLKNPSMHGMITASLDSPQFIPNPRFQASVAAMQGMLASGMYQTNHARFIAGKSVEYADALINELRKKER